VTRLAFDDALAERVRDPAPLKFRHKFRRPLLEHDRPAAVRKRDNCSVLGDDCIREAQVASYPLQVLEGTTGRQQYGDPDSAKLRDRFAHAAIEGTVGGDGAVVVEDYNVELHLASPATGPPSWVRLSR
jgi:hypothetical protein